jgi:thioesterase domain-containing protein
MARGQVECLAIDGDHLALLREPGIGEVAKHLARWSGAA